MSEKDKDFFCEHCEGDLEDGFCPCMNSVEMTDAERHEYHNPPLSKEQETVLDDLRIYMAAVTVKNPLLMIDDFIAQRRG